MCNYTQAHWEAVKRIIRYLKETRNLSLIYRSDGIHSFPLAYSDADYAGDVDTRRSTSSYVFMLIGGPVIWGSQRQKIVSLSTTEPEYVSACTATREVVWLKQLLKDIEYPYPRVQLC